MAYFLMGSDGNLVTGMDSAFGITESGKELIRHSEKLISTDNIITSDIDSFYFELTKPTEKMFSVKNILLRLNSDFKLENFCGLVIDDLQTFKEYEREKDSLVYFCGDVLHTKGIENLRVIAEFSTNYTDEHCLVQIGEVPRNFFNVGIYFPCFFPIDTDYYKKITSEHTFQTLGLSTKDGVAFRKGIYLTPITKENDVTKFNLLRCSTTLEGPTDNFRTTDWEIVNKINETIKFFYNNALLNHVLAQTYHNTTTNGKQRKAKISEHSDKTKDMPSSGLIVFCSFYENSTLINERSMTKLRFRRKAGVDESLEKEFDVTLHPNSVFVISLETNRLYTHEIIPSILPVDKIPVRMGYVIRCSNAEATFRDGHTYIGEKLLEPPTDEGIAELKHMYMLENTTTQVIDYSNKFYFSLNQGDYMEPIV